MTRELFEVEFSHPEFVHREVGPSTVTFAIKGPLLPEVVHDSEDRRSLLRDRVGDLVRSHRPIETDSTKHLDDEIVRGSGDGVPRIDDTEADTSVRFGGDLDRSDDR